MLHYTQARYEAFVAEVTEVCGYSDCITLFRSALGDPSLELGDVINSIPDCEHPYAVMSQLSELLNHDLRRMDAVMAILAKQQSTHRWRESEPQTYVESYWWYVIECLRRAGQYELAYRRIKQAFRGYRHPDKWYEHPPLTLSASRDSVVRLIHELYRAMRRDPGLDFDGDWIGRTVPLYVSVDTYGRKERAKRPGVEFVRDIGALLVDENRRPKRPFTTSQTGSQILEMAAFFAQK